MNFGNNVSVVFGKGVVWGVLLVGGFGSGKIVLCIEFLWSSLFISL